MPYPERLFCLGRSPNFITYYFSFFVLSRRPYLVAPYLTFKIYRFPNFKLYGIIPLLVGLLFLDLSSTTTPPLFPPALLNFLLLCSPKIAIVTLLYANLLAVILANSFLVTFAILLQLCLGFFLKFDV